MNVNFSVDLSNGESLDEAIDQLVLIREALYVTGDETETPDADIDTNGMEIEQKIPAAEGGTMPPNGDKIDLHAVSYHQPPPAGVDVDKNGLPWDSRIHASTKKKTAKDEWKKKRGVDPALVEQVEAELRQVMAAPAPVQSQFTPEELAPVVDINNAPNLENGAVYSDPGTADPAAVFGAPVTNFPLPPVENAPEQTTAVTDFPGLLTKVTARISDPNKGAAFSTGMQQVLKDSGLASIANLAARPDLVSTIDQKLDTLWNS